MDMPFPLGYIYGIGFKRGWLTVRDEYSGINDDMVFDNKFFSIEARLTRNYNLTPSLNFGWTVRYGLMVNSFQRKEFDGASSSSTGYNDDLPKVPLRYLPMKYPFLKNRANIQDQEVGVEENKVRGFINPKIRLSFMF
jgi:hypothetical protein